MVKLSPKDFIIQLEAMYKKQNGSVFVTFKHFTGVYSVKKSGKPPMKQIPTSKNPNDPQPGTPMLLIRASDGNKTKISSLVSNRDIVSFQIALDRIFKQNLNNFPKDTKPAGRPTNQ